MSDIYPSQAAGYGSEGLMQMAGTLAEQAESELADLGSSGHPLTRIMARTFIASVYASLANAAAIRERSEVIESVLSELAGESAELGRKRN